MAFTTINKSTDYFNTTLYTGNATQGKAVTSGFATDFVWIKNRGTTDDHVLFDKIRGGTKYLYSNQSSAEATYSSQDVTFENTGVNVGSYQSINQNSGNIASWHWKANGAGSANTDGSITSTVSANSTSGFSVAKYTGTGANTSFGHGLGSTPNVYIIKRLTGAAGTWLTYHSALGIGYHLGLNNNTAQNANDASFANNTAPDASKIYLGNWGDLNANGSDFICYSFADVQGYSKFGSYVGNGNADGTFVYTGFKPAFLMTKNTTTGSTDWTICDSKRDGFNDNNKRLFANQSSAESGSNPWQMYSNGFKMTTTGSFVNASGSNYIYMAFAEAPLVGTNNIPANAR